MAATTVHHPSAQNVPRDLWSGYSQLRHYHLMSQCLCGDSVSPPGYAPTLGLSCKELRPFSAHFTHWTKSSVMAGLGLSSIKVV